MAGARPVRGNALRGSGRSCSRDVREVDPSYDQLRLVLLAAEFMNRDSVHGGYQLSLLSFMLDPC